ncbi:MAG: two pore domain potassium channel family protein [Candidatus Eremiobacteraeota bacterium]|nr:two pore domain potassium channel family protein [Candidatus Eremiobacteraeota bacterium]MBV8365396.1 two pore domain potassium channel family protein [Candidatus Eremiobacteraeota bacterium]
MNSFDWILLIVGVTIVCLMLYDVFASVVLPRMAGSTLRLSVGMVRQTWYAWRTFALRIQDADKREDFLGRFAPAMLVGLLVAWLVGLLLGYGVIFYALRVHVNPQIHTFGDAIYFAGASVLTIGYGDFVATGFFTRMLALGSAATGLSLFALIISFIFSIFASFQKREVFVVMMGGRAGAPPSGVTLLETMSKNNLSDDFSKSLREAEEWSATVLESHLAYPILAYFRSSHDDESWIGTLGALLDAATMIITLTDSPLVGQATLMHMAGTHLVRDMAHYFRISETGEIGIERQEFDQACATLRDAGWNVTGGDEGWERFSRYRVKYAGALNRMARFWAIPPSRWIGDRSEIGAHALHLDAR